MSKRVILELELPDEVAEALQGEDLSARAKEAVVMEFLREHRISQGKAAEILGISRDELFPLMSKHQVSVVDVSPAELQEELRKPFPASQ